ncbi:MAG: MBL fold metallo-hydrolase [Planctomycetota bacterium]|nr:MBL fold metallo-hydrolase [Planctomycetota bacterium]
MSLEIQQLVTGDLEANCYLVWLEDQSDAIVVDPGGDEDEIVAALKRHGLTPAAFLVTHCHCDHIGALKALKDAYPGAPVCVPQIEAEWLQRPTLNLSYFFGATVTGPDADTKIADGDELELAGIELRALNVPGHSPGSMAYLIENGAALHAFCGDILFAGSIGRTDLPGGEGEDQLVANIRQKLFALPNETIVHPGHGPDTTIGREKENKPFCGEDA